MQDGNGGESACSLVDILRIARAGQNDWDCVDEYSDDSLGSGNRDFRLVDFGRGRFGLTHGALRMNATTGIDSLMADRTAETS